jgi:serine/threonine protein kinase
MSSPPPGDGHPERRDPAGNPADRGDGPRPAPADAGPAGDDAVVFGADAPDLSDETPTVITRGPRPPSSDEVLGGTLRGRRLAHFELIEPIGVGGMAAVIRARDLQLERQVALKILPPEMAIDEENVRRFNQEARAAAKLDHENIARVFFCGEDQKLHFIAFEFVEGLNLRALIERRGRLPVAETIRYMLQVASGLAHAAERGVIHRDIKPSNIIISPHGRAKLVDMGLARQLDPHRDQGLTQSGVTLGTFDYISPEQALEPRDADVRSDIYSLGCTFYHALTGQPPVPEGTAAKKLHHHQQVSPVDPRQLNPDIPDEVAAILARMMAKDPKDRYQRPEHLVQHLVQVAQKLGAISEVPDGVLFVDAPLPSPPRPRPVLMAVVAALALVALVVVLGQTGPRPTSPNGGREPRADNGQSEQVPPKSPPPTEQGTQPTEQNTKPPEQPPTPAVARAENKYDADQPRAEEVADFVRKAGETEQPSRLELADDLDLKDPGPAGPGLVFEGREGSTLIIEPRQGLRSPPTIRLKFNANRKPPDLLAALTVKSGLVIVRGVRFEINAAQSPYTAMAALAWRGGRLDVEDCEFVQADASPEGSRLSAVEVDGPPPGKDPPVKLTRSCFRSAPGQTVVAGQHVVTLRGNGFVQMRNCAFGPHDAVIAFQGPKDRTVSLGDVRVDLDHCSAMLTAGAAVVALENVDHGAVTAQNCLFARADQETAEGAPGTTLIRQADEQGDLFWTGTENRYYNLDTFWVGRAGESIVSLDDFQNKVNHKDKDSRVLATSPWKSEEPLAFLGAKGDKPREAFQVKTDMPGLRLAPEDKGTHLVGVEQLLGEKPYTDGLKALEEARVAAKKVVTPDEKTRRRHPGDYPSLEAALREARPGDTILLRCNGPYPVEPIRVRSTADVTIKPYPDCHPVLTLDPETDEEEASLFRLHDGKLHLEGLEFALHPARANFRAQAVVAALGDGECTFTDCVLTLEKAYDARLAAVALADLPGVRKTDDRPAGAPGQRASFAFKNCLVRGDGDLVGARTPRPFDLDVDNALVALGGSFLNVDLGEEPAPDAADGIQLSRVTAYLGGHLLRLHARDVKALMPVKFSPVSNCLFVSAAPTNFPNSLIHVDGPEVSDDRLKTLLTWEGQHNAYTEFTQLLDQQPDGGAMPAMPYGSVRWKEFTGETGAAFDRVRFRDRPAADAPLSRVTPARFKLKADDMAGPDMQTYGADIDLLPKVAAPADGMHLMPPEE